MAEAQALAARRVFYTMMPIYTSIKMVIFNVEWPHQAKRNPQRRSTELAEEIPEIPTLEWSENDSD
jgi:hypothetical protein